MNLISRFFLSSLGLWLFVVMANASCQGGVYGDYDYSGGNQKFVEYPCPAGRYAYGRGFGENCIKSSNCEGPCEAGYYCTAYSDSPRQNICPEGTFSQEGASECNRCPAGKWSNKGSSTCFDCPLGNYCPSNKNKAPCPTGKYGIKHGQTIEELACSPCEAGFFGSATGLTNSKCSGRCKIDRFCPTGSETADGIGKCLTGPIQSECDSECKKNSKMLSYYCPVNAIYGNLTQLSPCNAACNGVQSQTFTVTSSARYGGSEAVTITYYNSCNTETCACNLEQPWVTIGACKTIDVLGKVITQSRILYDPKNQRAGPPCGSGIQSVQLVPC